MERAIDTEFVALDLETTGLDPNLNRIVEVGAVIFKGNMVLSVYETLVNPGIRIHPKLTSIHGITNKMVRNSPTPLEAVSKLETFIGNRPLIIQNAPFDMGFIEAVRKEYSLIPLSNSIFDTYKLTQLVFPGLPSYSLSSLSRALDIIPVNEHRAVDDSMTARSVFLKCIERIDPQGKIDYSNFEKRFSLRTLLEIERSTANMAWPDGFDLLKKAWESSQKVLIVYCNERGTISRRVIAPTRLVRIGGKTMLEAWCFLRKENRTFRFDRIREISLEKTK